MTEWHDLYSIYAIDLSQQKEKINNFDIDFNLNIVRRTVPTDAQATQANPRSITCYVMLLVERSYKFTCTTGKVEPN